MHSAPNGPMTVTLTSPLPEGTPLTLLLTAGQSPSRSGAGIQVFLPIKPNGSTGWIPASEVKIQGDPYRLVVDPVDAPAEHLQLRQPRALVSRCGRCSGRRRRQSAPTTSPSCSRRPTPASTVTTPTVCPGHSPTLTDFDGYDAEIGLHGTGDPSSIGHSVSHGCVRLNNCRRRRPGSPAASRHPGRDPGLRSDRPSAGGSSSPPWSASPSRTSSPWPCSPPHACSRVDLARPAAFVGLPALDALAPGSTALGPGFDSRSPFRPVPPGTAPTCARPPPTATARSRSLAARPRGRPGRPPGQ